MLRVFSVIALLFVLTTSARAVTFVPQCRVSGVLQTCVGQLAPASGGAPDLSSVTAGYVLAGPCTAPPASATLRALCAADMPTGIDATKIGGGTVTNTIFSYLDATSSIQTQLNGKQSTLTLPLSVANGGTGTATGQLVPTGDNAQTLGDSTHRYSQVNSLAYNAGASNWTAGTTVANGAGAVGFDFFATNFLTSGTLFRVRDGGGSAVLTISSGSATANFQLDLLPTGDNFYTLGNSSKRWASLNAISLKSGTSTLTASSDVANSGTPVAFDVTNTVALTQSGNRYFRVKNSSSTELFGVGSAGVVIPTLSGTTVGTYTLGGTPTLGTSLQLDGDNTRDIGGNSSGRRLANVYAANVQGSGSTLSLLSSVADGAGANPVRIGSTSITYNNSTSRLLTLVNGGIDSTSFGPLGQMYGPSGLSLVLNSQVTDGSTKIAHSLQTTNTLSTDGAKLIAMSNGSTNEYLMTYAGMPGYSIGSGIAAAATIAPTAAITPVTSGTTTVDTITIPASCTVGATDMGCQIVLIPTANQLTWSASGNIAVAGYVPVNTAVIFTRRTTKWYPSYAGEAGSAITMVASSVASWTANQYIGPIDANGISATATNIAGFVLPQAGTLKQCRAQGTTATSGATALTMHKSAGGNSPSYSAQAQVISIANGDKSGADTNAAHAVTGSAGDLVIWRTDTTWAFGFLHLSCQFVPSS